MLLFALSVLQSCQFSDNWMADKRFRGTYSGKKVMGGSSKKYKYLDKRKRVKATVKKRKNAREQAHRQRMKRLNKRRKKLKKGGKSLYAYNPKKQAKNRKGNYPKNKSGMHSKITLEASLSAFLTSPTESINEAGRIENLFNNSNPGPVINLAAYYNLSDRLLVGPSMSGGFFGKENYDFQLTSLGVNAKYFITDPKRDKVKPYLHAAISHSYFNISQDGHTREFFPDPSYSVSEESDVLVNRIVYREPEVQLNFVPFIGYTIGVGSTFVLNKNIEAFAQIDMNMYNTYDKERIGSFFPGVSPSFNALTVSGGVKLYLFKAKSLY